MPAKKRSELTGIFHASDLGGGAWRLVRESPARAEVYLRGLEPRASDPFAGSSIRDLEIEWGETLVTLSATRGDRRCRLSARSAVIHQPLAGLYDTLPLAVFDGDAQRFWRRVFRVARLPGGRFLLRVLARGTRRRP